MTFEEDLRQENGTGVAFVLLTFTHPDFTSPLRLCSNPTEVKVDHPRTYRTMSRGDEFDYLPMKVILPGAKLGQSPQSTLSIADPQFLIQRTVDVLPIGTQVTALMELVHTSDVDHVEQSFPNFVMEKWDAKDGFFNASFAFDAHHGANYPSDVYSVASFPGLSG